MFPPILPEVGVEAPAKYAVWTPGVSTTVAKQPLLLAHASRFPARVAIAIPVRSMWRASAAIQFVIPAAVEIYALPGVRWRAIR